MSKTGAILAILKKAGHVMGDAPLRDYHAAKECVNASRCKDLGDTFRRCKIALKNYNVRVELTAGYVRIGPFDRSEQVAL